MKIMEVSPTYWDERAELMSRQELEKIQLNRLQKTLCRAYHHLPYFRDKINRRNIDIYRFQSLESLIEIPYSTKEDLRRAYPFGALAEPLSNIIRLHSSSGTTGIATVVGYTLQDIDTWAQLMARTLTGCGVNQDDMIQIAFGYGLFTGGLGVHYGAERLGATVIPMSSGNTLRQLQILQDFQISVLCCTPSYALFLAESARENQVDWEKTNFRIGIFGAEPWSEEMRTEIHKKLPIRAFDIYGLSEVIGPGVAFECEEQNGLHISEDHFLPEIIDPESGQPQPPGVMGELVFTTLTKEGTPVIRYRTGDLSSLDYSPCPCGRNLVRMHRVTSRTDDMLIIRGINVYPSQIESVLLRFEETEPHYQIIVDRKNFLDHLAIHVEVSSKLFSDAIKTLEKLRQSIENALKSELNVACSVKLMEPKSITRSEGKAQRVIDLRKKEESS